jgi:hypothetical protein
MIILWEIKQKEMMPPLLMIKMNIRGFFSLMKVIVLNLRTFRMMKNQENTPVYRRPIPGYTIPKYKSEIKSCQSNEKYLRPTLFCECRAPEIIAMAHSLGAYQKSDHEFAEAAFEFVKRKIILEIIPLDDVVPTLKRGTGTCVHKISLFIALCRAAGIRARYKFFALTMLDTWMAPALEHAPLMKKWYDAMGFFLLHGEGEVYIEGKWITADVGAEPQRQAASWMPVTKLGEDSAGLWLFPIPGTTFRRESVPLGLGIPSQILMRKLVPNQVAGINIGILEQIENGGKLMDGMGGETLYDTEARKRRRQTAQKSDLLKNHSSIIFGES